VNSEAGEVWDKQFEKDSKSGNLDKLANQAVKDTPSSSF